MIFLALLLTLGIIVLSVSVHYESLRILSRLLHVEQRWYSQRIRASLVVLGCLLVHTLEVIFFGLGFQLLEFLNKGTDLQGGSSDGFTNIYYSVVVYTSIGFGDVIPVTPAMRILTAAEGLTGAILIAWTASFMFFHMKRFWELDSSPD